MRKRTIVASILFAFLALFSTAAVAMTVYMKNDEQIDAESAWQAKGKVFVKVNNDLLLDFPADEVDLEKTFGRKNRELKSKGKTATVVTAHPEKPANISGLKPGTRIFSYVFSKDQISEIYLVGLYCDKRLALQQGCKGRHNVKPIGLSLIEPINLPNGKAHPVEGRWKITFSFERCGQTKIYNALFIAKNGQKPEVKPYFPGITNASPILLYDAMKGAYPAASIKLTKQNGNKSCKDLDIADMRITQQAHDTVEGGKTISGVWQEKWTFAGCGKHVDIHIDFMPDGAGGTNYSISNM